MVTLWLEESRLTVERWLNLGVDLVLVCFFVIPVVDGEKKKNQELGSGMIYHCTAKEMWDLQRSIILVQDPRTLH